MSHVKLRSNFLITRKSFDYVCMTSKLVNAVWGVERYT